MFKIKVHVFWDLSRQFSLRSRRSVPLIRFQIQYHYSNSPAFDFRGQVYSTKTFKIKFHVFWGVYIEFLLRSRRSVPLIRFQIRYHYSNSSAFDFSGQVYSTKMFKIKFHVFWDLSRQFLLRSRRVMPLIGFKIPYHYSISSAFDFWGYIYSTKMFKIKFHVFWDLSRQFLLRSRRSVPLIRL